MGRGISQIMAVLVALLLLAACGTSDDNGDSSAEAEDAAAAPEEAAYDDAEADSESLAGEQVDRQVITNASAEVIVDDPAETAEELIATADSAGGHVEDRREISEDEDTTTARLTLRIPEENLTEILEGLSEFGEVTELSQSAEDVTGVVRDLEARIEALEVSVERLQGIMEEAANAEELLEAEEVLSQRQADLESLQAERNALGDQVEMSTLHVSLIADEVAEVEADGFLGGLQSGWNGLVTVTNGLLVALGALLPWLVALGVPLALIAWGSLRLSRRRGRSGPPGGPQAGSSTGPSSGPRPGAPVPPTAASTHAASDRPPHTQPPHTQPGPPQSSQATEQRAPEGEGEPRDTP
ncbi:DUF4349 domain-containing protein [Nesterenkonia alba]|uniref:DUF4349 domain-containing protein n=1 Tax=Nesterenkonia alba TaxID=515814 RepID=UPI0003B56233|nr:DUF4349 domain-containing protein [Nesterenkonia alba]